MSSVVLMCPTATVQLVQKCYCADSRHPPETEVVFLQQFYLPYDARIFNNLGSQSKQYYSNLRNCFLHHKRKKNISQQILQNMQHNKHTIYLMKSTHHISKRNILH